MNISAGVLLIVAAIFNLMAGCTYAGFGGCAGLFAEMVLDDLEKQRSDPEFQTDSANEFDLNSSFTTEDKAPTDPREMENLKKNGAAASFYGFAIFILGAVMIRAAICAFKKKNASFVIITGFLVIISEIMGVLLWEIIFDFDMSFIDYGGIVTKSPGLIGGILAIISAKSFPSHFSS